MSSHPTTQAAQQRTLVTAENWGQPWSAHEVEAVAAERPCEDVATELGRTLYAVHNVREALRNGRPVGGGHRTPPQAEARVYTFIDGDVPDGW